MEVTSARRDQARLVEAAERAAAALEEIADQVTRVAGTVLNSCPTCWPRPCDLESPRSMCRRKPQG